MGETNTTAKGFQTSEGAMVAIQSVIGAAIAVLTLFGIAVPTFLKPDAQWVGLAALLIPSLLVALHSHNRTSLKKAIISAGASVVEATAVGSTVTTTPTNGNYSAAVQVGGSTVTFPPVVPEVVQTADQFAQSLPPLPDEGVEADEQLPPVDDNDEGDPSDSAVTKLATAPHKRKPTKRAPAPVTSK